MKKVLLKIDGMTCSACSSGLEKYLNRQKGIKTASVNLIMNNASIEYDNTKINLEQVEKYIEKAGFASLGIYKLESEEKKQTKEKNKLIGVSIVSILILYISMAHMVKLPVIPYLDMMHNPVNYAIALLILTTIVLIMGKDILKNGYKNLVHKTPNMDTLVTIGVIASFVYSIYGTVKIIKGQVMYVENLYYESAPHNALTSTEKILKSAQNKNYRTTSTKESVLKYVTDEVNLEDGESATSITIPHSNLQTVKYEYDEQNKVYKRYARKKAQTDWTTGKNLTTKNIIITMCDNETLDDGENKGRQTLKNIGTFNGYYITNGKAIKIKCIKKARNEQTIYEDLQGNEIKVNDGNTWVNICPTDAKIVIEGSEETEQENTQNNI